MPTQVPWKVKVQEMIQVCQDELKRTTEIGKRMLSASKTNSNLHEAYEELGLLAAKAIEAKEIDWKNKRVDEILEKIKNCEKNLEDIETEVNKIKFSPSPYDIAEEETKSDLKKDSTVQTDPKSNQ